jgi:hypothetical protein
VIANAIGGALPPIPQGHPGANLPAPKDSASVTSARSASADTGGCDAGMILVDGEYCPDAEQVCVKWLDPPPYQTLRCGEYAKPAKCKVPRVHRRYCIDREEFAESSPSSCPVDPDAPDGGESKPADSSIASSIASPSSGAMCVMPVVRKSWLESKALCEARGARLCKETEWEFACEGPEMSPYPYGWKRDSTICNFDKTNLGGAEDKLKDLRAPLAAYPDCMSPFGVHDMVGNVDEWVERENVAPPNRSVLRGGWWLPGRNRCRAATTGHGEEYSGKQVGFRCCKDVAPAPASAATP